MSSIIMEEIRSLGVSVIIPCRNEVNYIERCIQSITQQSYPGSTLEIIIADGMSDDGTREVLAGLCREYPNLRLIDNPEKIVSTGLNRAIRQAAGEIIIRMDVHTDYANDYVEQCVRTLQIVKAENVGGPARTNANGYVQNAIKMAYHSPFSVGGARFHEVDYEGYVDTVPYGCWKKTTLLEVGLFDEGLVRNQDDELNLRIIRAGGKIWQSPMIKSWYYPRNSIIKLFKQYAQYGYWKVRVIQKHRMPASVRHLVPGVFVAAIGLLSIASVFSTKALLGLILLLALYISVLVSASTVACAGKGALGFQYLPILPVIFAAFHVGYGCGFFRGIIDFMLFARHGRETLSSLTR